MVFCTHRYQVYEHEKVFPLKVENIALLPFSCFSMTIIFDQRLEVMRIESFRFHCFDINHRTR